MFFIVTNLYGELVWDLRDLPCGVFGKQLVARLWELDGAVITLVPNYLIGPFVSILLPLI